MGILCWERRHVHERWPPSRWKWCSSVLLEPVSIYGQWNRLMGMQMHNIQWVAHTTAKEKDLGLPISADMKVTEQYGIATVKGNKKILFD